MLEITDIGHSLKSDYQRWLSACAEGNIIVWEALYAQLLQTEQALLFDTPSALSAEEQMHQTWASPIIQLDDDGGTPLANNNVDTIDELHNTARMRMASEITPPKQAPHQPIVDTKTAPIKTIGDTVLDKKIVQHSFMEIGQNRTDAKHELPLEQPLAPANPQQFSSEPPLHKTSGQSPIEQNAIEPYKTPTSDLGDHAKSAQKEVGLRFDPEKSKTKEQTTENQTVGKKEIEYLPIGGLSAFARQYADDVPAESADKTVQYPQSFGPVASSFGSSQQLRQQDMPDRSQKEMEDAIKILETQRDLGKNTADSPDFQAESMPMDTETLLELIEQRIEAAFKRFYG